MCEALPLNSQSSIITSREIRKGIIRVKDYREMITIESIKNQRKHLLDTFQNRKDFSSQNLVSNKTRTKERIISRVDVPTVSRSYQRGWLSSSFRSHSHSRSSRSLHLIPYPYSMKKYRTVRRLSDGHSVNCKARENPRTIVRSSGASTRRCIPNNLSSRQLAQG